MQYRYKFKSHWCIKYHDISTYWYQYCIHIYCIHWLMFCSELIIVHYSCQLYNWTILENRKGYVHLLKPPNTHCSVLCNISLYCDIKKPIYWYVSSHLYCLYCMSCLTIVTTACKFNICMQVRNVCMYIL